jgi:hypothetical protein
MKKGLLFLVAGLMAFGVAVQSMASARIDSLSSDVRQVEDMDIIWLYPNKALQYKNTVDWRFVGSPFTTLGSTPGDNWGGLLLEEKGLGVVGFYVSKPSRRYTAAQAATGNNFRTTFQYYWTQIGNRNPAGGTPENYVNIFWADSLGDADLGINLSYGNTGVGGQETSAYGLNVGLGFKDAGPFSEANLHLELGLAPTNIPGDKEYMGTYTVKLGGLAQSDIDADTAMRVYADLRMDQDNVQQNDYSDYGALVGIGCNHKVNGGKAVVSHGLAVDYLNITNGDPVPNNHNHINMWNLVWYGSAEVEATSWLTLRTGLVSVLVSRVYDDNAGPTYYSNEANPVWSCGFGVNWQNFVLDCNVNVSSLESLIANPEVGGGILYPSTNPSAGTGIVNVVDADLRYRF